MDNEEYILAALFAMAKDFDSLRRQDLKNHPKSDAATKWRSMQGRSRALVFRSATTALTEMYPDELSIESTSYDSELMNSARNTFCEVVTNISNAVGSGYSEKNIENDALRDILNESESSGGPSEQTRRNFIENLVIMAAFLDCASDREPGRQDCESDVGTRWQCFSPLLRVLAMKIATTMTYDLWKPSELWRRQKYRSIIKMECEIPIEDIHYLEDELIDDIFIRVVNNLFDHPYPPAMPSSEQSDASEDPSDKERQEQMKGILSWRDKIQSRALRHQYGLRLNS